MADFPIFISSPSPEGLKPAALSYKSLDFGPLLKSVRLRNQTEKKTKTVKEDKPIDALTGGGKQYYGEIDRHKNTILKLEGQYGTGASEMPEYKKALGALSSMVSPSNIVALKRQKEQWVNDQATIKGDKSSRHIDIDHFHNTGEFNTLDNRLTENDLAATDFMSNPELYGTRYYDYNFNPGGSAYNHEDALAEFDKIFNTANDQFNLSSNEIDAISTTIATGTGGNVDVLKKELKFNKDDLKSLTYASKEAEERFTGGFLNLSDPLVNGMYQSFLNKVGGGQGNAYIEDANGNAELVSLEGGTSNKNWNKAFHYYTKETIDNHLKKRYNEKLIRQTAYSKMGDAARASKRKANKNFLNSPSTSGSSSHVIRNKRGKVFGSIDPDLVNKTNEFFKSFEGVFDFSNLTTDKDDDYQKVFIRKKLEDQQEIWSVNDRSAGPRGQKFKDPLVAIQKELDILKEQGYAFGVTRSGLPMKETESEEDLQSDYAELPILSKGFAKYKKERLEKWEKDDDGTAQPQDNELIMDYHSKISGQIKNIKDDIVTQTSSAVQLNATEDFYEVPIIKTQVSQSFTNPIFVEGNDASLQLDGLQISLSPGSIHAGKYAKGTINKTGSVVEFALGAQPYNWYYNDKATNAAGERAPRWGYWDASGMEQTEPNWERFANKENGGLLLPWTFKSAEENDIYKSFSGDSKNNPIHGAAQAWTTLEMKVEGDDIGNFVQGLFNTKIYTSESDYDAKEVEKYTALISEIQALRRHQVTKSKKETGRGRDTRQKTTPPSKKQGETKSKDERIWITNDPKIWGKNAKQFKTDYGIDKALAVDIRDFLQVKHSQKVPKKTYDLASEYITHMYRNQGLTEKEIESHKQHAKQVPLWDEEYFTHDLKEGIVWSPNVWKTKAETLYAHFKNGTLEELGLNKLAATQLNIRFVEDGDKVHLLYNLKAQISSQFHNELDEDGKKGYEKKRAEFNAELYGENSSTKSYDATKLTGIKNPPKK